MARSITLSLNEDDQALLQEVATDCGYEQITAFVRAIARGDIPVGHTSKINVRIDKLRDRLNTVEAQQKRDYEVLADMLEKLAN